MTQQTPQTPHTMIIPPPHNGYTTARKGFLPVRILKATLFRRDVFGIAFALILVASLYWGIIASNLYVSEARIIVDKVDFSVTPSFDLSSMLTGSQSSRDQLLLRDYLLSTDMMNNLEEKLHLREHYSNPEWDRFSRLSSVDVPNEEFHQYYLSRISVEPDSFSDVLVVRVSAFTPEMAHAIAQQMISDGESFMNEMAHRLALEQVNMLEQQVEKTQQRLVSARKQVIDYQNEHNLISPENAIAGVSSIASEMESKLAELRVRREALLSYLNPNAPDVVSLTAQIQALEQQISQEQKKLTTSATASPRHARTRTDESQRPLNQIAEEYQRYQAEVELLQDMYNSGLLALEKGRIDATRTIKKLSTIQTPTNPQFPLEPNRLYNIVVFAIYALLVAGILHLLTAIVKEHND